MRTIFVSSTFKDMQAERDAIRDIVTPSVNIEAQKHNDSIDFCDLRWGVTTEELDTEAGSRKILQVCFREIDRSSSPLIALLGYRYGWIPSEDIVKSSCDLAQMQVDDLESSVTALELVYGSTFRCRPTIVYMRELLGDVPDCYCAESPKHAAHLQRLKRQLADMPNVRVRTYSVHMKNGRPDPVDITAFANMVAKDLIQRFSRAWKGFDHMTPIEQAFDRQWAFIEEKDRLFSARKRDSLDCMGKLEKPRGKPVLCVGEVGSGKSTILAHIALELKKEGNLVLPIACGLTSACTTPLGVLRLLVQGASVLCTETPFGDKELYGLQVKDLQSKLLSLAKKAYTSGKPITILIDAVDQLIKDAYWASMIFLPDGIASFAKVFVTCTIDETLRIPTSHVLHPLTMLDKFRVINSVVSNMGKELPEIVRDEILSTSSSSNPLYLSLVTQRLRLMWAEDFQAEKTPSDPESAITDQQLSVVRSCPPDVVLLSRSVLEEVCARVAPRFGMRAISYIAVSRLGLRSSDIATLCGDAWNQLGFSLLMSFLAEDCFTRDDGRIDFTHKCVREAFSLERMNAEAHKHVAQHLASLPDDDSILQSELVFHAIHAMSRQVLTDHLDRCAKSDNAQLGAGTVATLLECSYESQGRWFAYYISQLDLGDNDEKQLNALRFLCFSLIPHVPVDATQREIDGLLPVCKALTERLGNARTTLERVLDYPRACFNAYRALQFLYIRSGNQPLAMDAARSALGFAKYVYGSKSWDDKLNLYYVYYNTLVALKSSNVPAVLTSALELAEEGLSLLEYPPEELVRDYPDYPLGQYYGCMGEMYDHLGDYQHMYEIYSRDYALRSEAYKANRSRTNRIALVGGATNVCMAVARLKDATKADEAYERLSRAIRITDEVCAWEDCRPAEAHYLGKCSIIGFDLDSIMELSAAQKKELVLWAHRGIDLDLSTYINGRLQEDRLYIANLIVLFIEKIRFANHNEYVFFNDYYTRWQIIYSSLALKPSNDEVRKAIAWMLIAVSSVLYSSEYAGHYLDMLDYLNAIFDTLAAPSTTDTILDDISGELYNLCIRASVSSAGFNPAEQLAFESFQQKLQSYVETRDSISARRLKADIAWHRAREAEKRLPCAGGLNTVADKWQICADAFRGIDNTLTLKENMDYAIAASRCTLLLYTIKQEKELALRYFDIANNCIRTCKSESEAYKDSNSYLDSLHFIELFDNAVNNDCPDTCISNYSLDSLSTSAVFVLYTLDSLTDIPVLSQVSTGETYLTVFTTLGRAVTFNQYCIRSQLYRVQKTSFSSVISMCKMKHLDGILVDRCIEDVQFSAREILDACTSDNYFGSYRRPEPASLHPNADPLLVTHTHNTGNDNKSSSTHLAFTINNIVESAVFTCISPAGSAAEQIKIAKDTYARDMPLKKALAIIDVSQRKLFRKVIKGIVFATESLYTNCTKDGKSITIRYDSIQMVRPSDSSVEVFTYRDGRKALDLGNDALNEQLISILRKVISARQS